MKTKRRTIGTCGWAALLVLLAACAKPDNGPQPIALGEDDCGLCKMIISEQNYAAQARFDGTTEKYDDIGCLGERLAGATAPQAMWVADQRSGAWIDARAAVYVHAPELKTPMASGLAAFADRAAAERFAAEKKGRILALEDVRAMRRPQ